MSLHEIRALLVSGCLFWSTLAPAGPVTSGADPQSSLKYWEWKGNGVVFRLTQRLPDQTRAFFLARGFDKDSADLFATRCVFQSMFRNTGGRTGATVRIDLRQWQVKTKNQAGQLRVREDWNTVWINRQLPQSALIAFEWSLLPTQQEYAPDDYNWGMTSYGLPPGSRFDLVFTWYRNNEMFNGLISDIECAPDVHPDPDSATP